MTNESNEKGKAKKKIHKDWKRVGNIQAAVSKTKRGLVDDRTPKPRGRKFSAPEILRPLEEHNPDGADGTATSTTNDVNNDNSNSGSSSSGKSARIYANRRAQMKRSATQPALIREEPVVEEGDDPVSAYKTNTFQVIRGAFELAKSDDGGLKINVDNVVPLLRSMGLNAKDDLVMDMVRDACMESTGDIEPQQFDEVVNTLVKRLDDDLWTKRLEEKEHLRHEHEAKKARLEAEKLRKADERRKAGFNEEDEEEGEWEQYERLRLEEIEKKKQEHKCDELYDNIKMAFRFIDADGDGVITTKDLYTLMMGLGEMMTDDDLFGMFTMADIDCDGKVTFDDFKNFLMPGSANENSAEETQEQSDSKPNPDSTSPDTDIDSSKQLNQDGNNTTEVTTNKPEASVTPEVKSQLPDVTPESSEVTPNNGEEVNNDARSKRFSILRGYKTVSARLNQQALKPEPEVKESSSPEAPPSIHVTPSTEASSIAKPTIETTPALDTNADETKTDEGGIDCVDAFNHLIAIREEDEHSNYELQEPYDTVDGEGDKITATSVSAALESKRKHFVRQGSSASLKTRPNSALTTESICDSGIDTMDNLYGSEIREQPDVFDLSDDDEMTGDVHNNTPCGSFVIGNSKSSVYEMNEDDEDMVEARHVQESLARVSSPGGCDLIDQECQTLLSIDARKSSSNDSGIAIERLDIKEDEMGDEKIAKSTEERLAKAKQLQSLISSRSLTSPRTTCYTSRSSSKVDRADLPTPMCSQIDINLTCEAPPKADVRSRRGRRLVSARTPRTVFADEKPDQTMTVIEVGDGISEQAPGHVDLPRFPSRPLIRPNSQRRPISARMPVKGRIDIESLSVDVRPVELGDKTSRRPKSAVPFLRTASAPQILIRARRPMTANAKLSYTGSRRMEKAFSKLPNGDDAKLIHPHVEQEYPNKAVLTTLHHGFKTFWPMGRSANVIKDKRPFQSFELNSYSRSIERSAIPFKGVSTVSASADKMEAVRPVDERVFKITNHNMKHIHLDLDVKGSQRPRARSAFVPGRRTPNTVR